MALKSVRFIGLAIELDLDSSSLQNAILKNLRRITWRDLCVGLDIEGSQVKGLAAIQSWNYQPSTVTIYITLRV
jgi:hypothetical protein